MQNTTAEKKNRRMCTAPCSGKHIILQTKKNKPKKQKQKKTHALFFYNRKITAQQAGKISFATLLLFFVMSQISLLFRCHHIPSI